MLNPYRSPQSAPEMSYYLLLAIVGVLGTVIGIVLLLSLSGGRSNRD